MAVIWVYCSYLLPGRTLGSIADQSISRERRLMVLTCSPSEEDRQVTAMVVMIAQKCLVYTRNRAKAYNNSATQQKSTRPAIHVSCNSSAVARAHSPMRRPCIEPKIVSLFFFHSMKDTKPTTMSRAVFKTSAHIGRNKHRADDYLLQYEYFEVCI